MAAEHTEVGWGGWGVRDAAVTGGWVGGKVRQENADLLTGKTTSCDPEKDTGLGLSALRRIPVGLQLLRPTEEALGQ